VFLYFSKFILIIFLFFLFLPNWGVVGIFAFVVALVLDTRSGCSGLFDFDPEIERALHARRRANQASTSSPPVSDSDSDYFHNLFDSDSKLDFNNMVEQRTLKQLAAPDMNYNGLCIEYVDVTVPFELKSGLIHLLPRFSGLAGEDPHKHLKEFQVVCSTPLRPEGITEDHIKLRAFPFSLQGAAKDLLYYLEPNSVTTWNDLKRVFLERYFPASGAASIQKDICGIRQGNESLAEYWERFKQLVSSCPQHQITEQLLIQYFYEGLLPMDRNILDVASGGALVDKTPVAAKALIENMSLNSQQFTTRNNYMVQTKGVNDIHVSSSNKALETRIEELTSLVKQMAVSKPQTTKLCGICTSTEHPTDTCPILQDDSVTQLPQAYAANFFNQSNNQKGYNIPDLSTNKYHPNWRNHPNLRYGNQQPTQQQLVIPLPQPHTTPQVSTSSPSGPLLEELVK
jgi:hypothetical protein